ncbi:hypothetical protein BDKNPLJD_00225 [Lactobacillus helveticus]|uniref:Uncharacterized protein n=1 Tax=Lactobacillus helveticus TaxID=1587 RepID=A0A2X0SWL9_LACHE|nr:hypothetical protein AAULH_08503 [Lactobacillus helveticus MTCC 5463]GFP10122.1 hypothetical protein LHEJCM1007_02310 [Lactobacillus helveticus]GFP12240.1 hypothetical protein LHEJCM1062_01120 [Lactobacillus helveticus]SPS13431.1 hypothetical protein BDKNPLJD_00225 [Lactobacillus helveticus]
MLKKTKWNTAIVAVLLGAGIVSTNHVQADAVSNAQSNTQVVQNSNQSQSSTTEKKAPAFNKSDYLSSNPKIIRLKHNATIYKGCCFNSS